MREHQGPFLAVAYADETLGEIGTIYQAAGAIYTGTTDPKGQADYIVNGRKRSAWQVRKRYGTRDRKALKRIDPAVTVMPLRPKHRYLFIGAEGSKRRTILSSVQAYSRPYPKRSGLAFPVPFSYGHHMESEMSALS
jgi:hypothetical protein